MADGRKSFRWIKGASLGAAFSFLVPAWYVLRHRELTLQKYVIALVILFIASISVILLESLSHKPWTWNRSILVFMGIFVGLPLILMLVLTYVTPQYAP